MNISKINNYSDRVEQLYRKTRESLLQTLQQMDGGQFQRKVWRRPGGGGGEMAILRGKVFEKAGVNFSLVEGFIPKDFRNHVPYLNSSGAFQACGVSLVIHPMSPFVPAVHMNIRYLVTTKAWFGGGADITPVFDDKISVDKFHQAMKEACDSYRPNAYQEFSQACEDYFFLPHRNVPRGAGGVFFEQLSGNFEKDLSFTLQIPTALERVYSEIVKNNGSRPWTKKDKEAQLKKRALYVEFNLIHDKGTLFGLKTDANIDALFMSLPPGAAW